MNQAYIRELETLAFAGVPRQITVQFKEDAARLFPDWPADQVSFVRDMAAEYLRAREEAIAARTEIPEEIVRTAKAHGVPDEDLAHLHRISLAEGMSVDEFIYEDNMATEIEAYAELRGIEFGAAAPVRDILLAHAVKRHPDSYLMQLREVEYQIEHFIKLQDFAYVGIPMADIRRLKLEARENADDADFAEQLFLVETQAAALASIADADD